MPQNYTEAGLKARIKMREKQIKALKQELGIASEPETEYKKLSKELKIEDFSENLLKDIKEWKRKKSSEKTSSR